MACTTLGILLYTPEYYTINYALDYSIDYSIDYSMHTSTSLWGLVPVFAIPQRITGIQYFLESSFLKQFLPQFFFYYRG